MDIVSADVDLDNKAWDKGWVEDSTLKGGEIDFEDTFANSGGRECKPSGDETYDAEFGSRDSASIGDKMDFAGAIVGLVERSWYVG